MKSDLVDIELTLRINGDAAYAVWNGKRDKGREVWVWLPKSLVERDGSIFTMPEWLAIEKGLV